MSRLENRLTARRAAVLGIGRHSDGAGLYLRVDNSGRRWVWRFSWRGAIREMGLGAASDVTLAEARKLRSKWRAMLSEGKDPIAARQAEWCAHEGAKTFGQCAVDLISSKVGGWKSAKHRAQWRSTLETYCESIWGRPVEHIDITAVLSVLQPIWQDKAETASRLRGRIEAVLDWAAVHKLRGAENPARWKGNLDKLLPRPKKLTRGHFKAMAYPDVPAFLKALRGRKSTAALALELAILTACRSGEVLGACWREIDFDTRVWTIPKDRMKIAREHRVPLSKPALALLEQLHEVRTGEYVFPGQRHGKPLSGMAMEMQLRRMKVEDTTVHGFRSAFRDWCGNETHFPRELAEEALAHVIGDKAEQAYRRSAALEKRRVLMQAWADYLDQVPGANVLAFRPPAG